MVVQIPPQLAGVFGLPQTGSVFAVRGDVAVVAAGGSTIQDEAGASVQDETGTDILDET